MCKQLNFVNYLHTLNLSENKISNKGAEYISEMLKYNISIKQLFLHWNLIKPNGGKLLFQALAINQYVISFDISFNTLGCHQDANLFTSGWNQFCLENKVLLHLDLSFNNFSHEQLKQMSVSLKQNHTLLGIHLVGVNGAKINN